MVVELSGTWLRLPSTTKTPEIPEAIVRHFQNWISAYAQYTADSESPSEFHFWTGVWVVAGALRRRVWIDMRKYQWTPNFYIVLVGPPGIVAKSTTIRVGMRLLESVEGVRFGPASMTWQKLADSLSRAVEHLRIDEDTYVPMSCLSIALSELGTFLKIEDTSLIDVLVDLWDGQLSTWGHATRTQGEIEIKNPWLNVIGCTTPAWLKANFPTYLIGGGLTSRIIFVYGEKKRRLVPYPDEITTHDTYRDLESRLVEDLKKIAQLSGEFALTRDAREWGHAWYEKHWSEVPSHLASERYEGYRARKQAHLHKLAMILSAAQRDTLDITAADLQLANDILSEIEPHMIKVFDSIGVPEESRHVQEILPFIRAYGFITPDDLWQKVMNIMSHKDFREALHAASRANLIRVGEKHGQRGLVINDPTSGEAP